MKYDIKGIFNQVVGVDSFRRIGASHPLDLYLGKDAGARKTLLFITAAEPLALTSSNLVNVQTMLRADGNWSLSFSLCDNGYEDVFCNLCEDIIAASEDLQDAAQGTQFVCNRYVEWQELLKKTSGNMLSPAAMKGLVGELWFLKEFMFEHYGPSEALRSWIGPDKADQDFVAHDSWYEVKAKTSGAESVQISSVEQLDTQSDGELVVVFLDKTSRTDPQRVTLNSLVAQVEGMLPTSDDKRLLGDILLRQGYIRREEYNDHPFRFQGMVRYQVDQTFPAIRRVTLPAALINARYDLSLASIENYKKEA